ncbi:SWIM zinc finger domain-containing protein [Myxococcus stipitatus DSM 14675]|uniref:SWIM zinc finger domain-containing protein n=1 Tax=Myxococcus stipitatus (strain DSM 14675 / JCM 12634 / Mx s8) TaxID=1278073 RepID=L7UMU1_MYXSD|nr:SWIM zinc finger domain-containing protein [Myxococcus stipitatus DSM 14675]
MSRWDGWGWKSAPKRPPPEHGIKLKKAGSTWWGQAWLEALERVLGGDSGRLARGRTYARAGRTHDLVVGGSGVTAKVTGSRPRPYVISLKLGRFGEAVWEKALAGMAGQARYAAELLDGRMPQDIDAVFRAAGVSLFPESRKDLTTSCSCPDWGDPCKHVAATHYVLGEALDGDPFLLFELRGRTKAQVLEALRAARGGEAVRARRPATQRAKTQEARARPEVVGVKPGKLTEVNYDQPRAPLPTMSFSFDAPVVPGAVLRQLGAPGSWGAEDSPGEVLAPNVRAAAEVARRIALQEPGDLVEDVGATRTRRRSRKRGGG